MSFPGLTALSLADVVCLNSLSWSLTAGETSSMTLTAYGIGIYANSDWHLFGLDSLKNIKKISTTAIVSFVS